MDEMWERAVDTAIDGQTDVKLVRTLTLDGAVKCVQGRLPPPSLFEKFQNLQHLSMANIGVSSLERFPRLRNMRKLILSDNRIAGGLEFLVEAGLESLRDLDLSNNRISDITVLRPLAELRLVSLDLYECPVTRVKDYRNRVFGLIRSLKYLDKMDAEENERPESDEEEEEEDDDDEDDDPGSGEIDGDDHPFRLRNRRTAGNEGVVDADEDEESDADEEEAQTSRGINGLNRSGNSHHHSNGFRVEAVDRDEEDDGDDADDSVEEVYEDDEGEDEDLFEVLEVDDSDDSVEDDDEDEEVDNDERGFVEPESTGRLTTTDGEIDAHEQGEDDADEGDDGETGDDEHDEAVEEDLDFEDEDEEDEEDDEYGSGYLVQPVERVEAVGDVGEDPEVEENVEVEDEDGEVQELPPSSSSSHKRKRSG